MRAKGWEEGGKEDGRREGRREGEEREGNICVVSQITPLQLPVKDSSHICTYMYTSPNLSSDRFTTNPIGP